VGLLSSGQFFRREAAAILERYVTLSEFTIERLNALCADENPEISEIARRILGGVSGRAR